MHIDYETFSPVDLIKCGLYRYAEEAEITLCAYAIDDGPEIQIDLLAGESYPQEFIDGLRDPNTLKWAQNAQFERIITKFCLKIEVPAEQWRCTQVWASGIGLPGKLETLSKVLHLKEEGKLKSGKALIRKFCVPRKPTKKILRTRNMPSDYPEDWEEFKRYNVRDVVAERAVHKRLQPYPLLESEWQLWFLDQEINDRGIRIDMKLVRNSIDLAEGIRNRLMDRAKEITQLINPNSRKQILDWLADEGIYPLNLTKATVAGLLGTTNNERVEELLAIRQRMAKTSVSKFDAIARSISSDGRLRGTLKFNGAGRTCRWAGQILQPQNLPSKLKITDVPTARRIVLDTPDLLEILYENVSEALVGLIRPTIVADVDEVIIVTDFSAIEARILAWVAQEQWRLDLFARDGKLYEESAEKMFHLEPGSVTKKSPYRAKGKVSELALGYQGWEGALITMGALEMGLTLDELTPLAQAWREANPAIVKFWKDCERAAIKAVKTKTSVQVGPVTFESDKYFMWIVLPSGRKLMYASPKVGTNDRGNLAVAVEGLNGETKQWERSWLYGGLITENICQAIARDCLAQSMKLVAKTKWGKILLHVHDEMLNSVPMMYADIALSQIERIMGLPIPWAPGLLLKGEGFITDFYIKED